MKPREYVNNPLVPQRADPWCVRGGDGCVYFTGSVPAYDRIEILKAPSLRELAFAEPKVVWRKHQSGPMSFHIWAPELHFIDGRWFLYFAAGRAESVWDIRMWVLENPNLDPTQGNWEEKGQLFTDWDSFSLDFTTFEHRGARYGVWAQKDPQIVGNTNLYIAAMEDSTSIRGPQRLLTRPELEWETQGFGVNEGAAVLVKNGRVWVTYSGSATDARYCMGLLWADGDSDWLDPSSWHKSPHPVLESSAENGQFGPGHSCFFQSADEQTDLLIYHARPYRDIEGNPLYDPNRHARVGLIKWDAAGMPVFGAPASDGPLRIGR